MTNQLDLFRPKKNSKCPTCETRFLPDSDGQCRTCMARFHGLISPTKMLKSERVRELEFWHEHYEDKAISQDLIDKRVEALIGRQLNAGRETFEDLINEVKKQDQHPQLANRPKPQLTHTNHTKAKTSNTSRQTSSNTGKQAGNKRGWADDSDVPF